MPGTGTSPMRMVPYIELMTGVFTDNQPDFSWIQPNEVKSFEQYFMPYALIGAVKNATKEAMVNMEIEKDTVHLKVYATGVYKNATVVLFHKGSEIKRCYVDLSPEEIFIDTYEDAQQLTLTDLQIVVADANGHELVSWQPAPVQEKTRACCCHCMPKLPGRD